MKFTGEFFIPGESNDGALENAELEIEHRQRYLSILRLTEGKNVLDIASGEGYGTFLISAKAARTIGVDINPELIDHASEKYKRNNLQYKTGSITDIPLEDHSVDIIISFETLEHVSQEMQLQFMKEAKRVLIPNGTLIISTPDKKNYTDRFSHHNKFHVHELYKEEFNQLLNAHFKYISLSGQGMEVASLILKEDDYTNGAALQHLSVSGNFNFDPKYLIAICSDDPEAVQTPIASIVPENKRSFFQMMDRILELQREVEELGAWGTRSVAELESLSKELQKAHESIAILTQKQDKSDEETGRLIRQLAQSRHENFIKEAEIEVLTHHKNATTSTVSTDMEKFTAEVARLSDTIANRKKPSFANLSEIAAPTRQSQPQPPSTPDPQTEHLAKEIARLEKDLSWYRKTYADRSLLGVLRQKMTDKFRK